MIEFYLPQSMGEWLAWLTALACVLVGLYLMILPRGFMTMMGFADSVSSKAAVSEVRGPFGGVYFGFGLSAMLFAQPLVYMALGLAFVGAVIGRLISFAFDRAFGTRTLIATACEVVAAFFPLAYVIGLIG